MDSFISCVREEFKSGENECSAGRGQQNSDVGEEVSLCKKTKRRSRLTLCRVTLEVKEGNNMPFNSSPSHKFSSQDDFFLPATGESRHVNGNKRSDFLEINC